MPEKSRSIRKPVDEGLSEDMPAAERRPARMRLVAGRRLAGLTVVVDGLHDPHNISAVLRSCDGFGVQHVHIIGDPNALPVNRAITRGCQKWLTLHYHPTAAACADVLHAQGFELWAAVPDRRAGALDAVDFSRRIALVFGAERAGLSKKLQAECDGEYIIPMAGFSQSLNVSVAAAVSLYVGASRCRASVGGPTDLSPDEVEALVEQWTKADRERSHRL